MLLHLKTNQLVFVAYTVDPTCSDSLVAIDNTPGSEQVLHLSLSRSILTKTFKKYEFTSITF